MPARELDGYIRAANKMCEQCEQEKPGLSGEQAIKAAQNDPAIKVK